MRKKTMEEYLEVIDLLQRKDGRAQTGRIASEMRVRPSSATQMLRKLQREGLLEYRTYEGAALTPAGLRVAEELGRRHRALADFLEIIGLDEEAAERDACQIEHHISRSALEQLEKFVQFACISGHEPGWVSSFRRYCETGEPGECGSCTHRDAGEHGREEAGD
ncbi:MAG: metal-dependent transcriptional regulator [Methanothrix sp.]|nr:metal-dependent transcriptional regulator [Methanothrix sp.]